MELRWAPLKVWSGDCIMHLRHDRTGLLCPQVTLKTSFRINSRSNLSDVGTEASPALQWQASTLLTDVVARSIDFHCKLLQEASPCAHLCVWRRSLLFISFFSVFTPFTAVQASTPVWASFVHFSRPSTRQPVSRTLVRLTDTSELRGSQAAESH